MGFRIAVEYYLIAHLQIKDDITILLCLVIRLYE